MPDFRADFGAIAPDIAADARVFGVHVEANE